MKGQELTQQFFEAMELAVFRRTDREKFEVVMPLPGWFKKLYPEIAEKNEVDRFSRYVSFLTNFLSDAETFWKAERKGRLKSYEWVERDAKGRELILNAVAFVLAGENYFLIECGFASRKDRKVRSDKSKGIKAGIRSLAEPSAETADKRTEDDLLEALRNENELLKQVILEYEEECQKCREKEGE
ncbi:MAG: hypothetical protein GXO77_02700 [Calditrichaeota bacterium]|nr:hypothetical protein [Calditrichota bacterium]